MKLPTRFGRYGGVFVPELLVPALEQLEAAFLAAQADSGFRQELDRLLREYAGRPTPITRCRRLAADTASAITLKREDLLHGGAHKTNQVIGQALLAQRLGKRRIIAETGAGQHGVATAMVGALFGFETVVYMGAVDAERQRPNVQRMELLGAEVVRVHAGAATLEEALNEALRDWAGSYPETHYLIGTAAGPHPFPTVVREFQRVIGREARAQFLEREGGLPDAVVACVGGGSNAIGMFAEFLERDDLARDHGERVPRLYGAEAAGRGLHSGQHGATLCAGSPGVLHGAHTVLLQDEDGQVRETHSVAAGLDYPGVGPEHAHLRDCGRVEYRGVEDAAALAAFEELSRCEGIIPAIESAHAVALALELARGDRPPRHILVNLSGRGDKDLATWGELRRQAPHSALADGVSGSGGDHE